MFFNPEPEKFFPCAQIDVVQFPDGEGGRHIAVETVVWLPAFLRL